MTGILGSTVGLIMYLKLFGGSMKKSFLFVLGLFAAVVCFTSCMNLVGDEVTYTTMGGKTEIGWGFDSLDDLGKSLDYLEDKISGQITFGGWNKEFEALKSSSLSNLTFEDTYYKPSRSSIQKAVVVKETTHWNEESSSNLGMGYSMHYGYYTYGILIYVYDAEKDLYSDGVFFDFRDRVSD